MQSPSDKWRRKFGSFLKRERERNPLLSRRDCPDDSYQAEIETFKTAPDLPYFFRLMMTFLAEGKPLPLPPHLHRLLILWILARIETVYEPLNFRERAVSDYSGASKPKSPKKADYKNDEAYEKDKELYEEEINKVFGEYWDTWGVEVQNYIQDLLSPIEKELESELNLVERIAKSRASDQLPALDLFPKGFEPLTVIVGDYFGEMNRPPKHVSELFRQSQSLINLHYLLNLKLPEKTEIVSDHLFLQLSEDERAQELGNKHLLIIGSPLVNSVSRHLILNKSLIFNFVYDESTYRLGKDFYDFINEEGLLEIKPAVEIFYQMMETLDEINIDDPAYTDSGVNREDREKIKEKVLRIRDLAGETKANNRYVTQMFSPKKRFSPLKPNLDNFTREDEEEFAVISLGENHWSNRLRQNNKQHKSYAIIAVCGVNRVSTAIALKALANKDNLNKHPLGGLLEITKFKSNGTKRITKSTYKWLDEEYQIPDILTKVGDALKSFKKPSVFSQYFKTEGELETYVEMVKHFMSKEELEIYEEAKEAAAKRSVKKSKRE